MSIEEVLEALERYIRESAEGDRQVALEQYSYLMAGTALLLAGGFQFSEDPERGELLDARNSIASSAQHGYRLASTARATLTKLAPK
jgi:hypothetical protein